MKDRLKPWYCVLCPLIKRRKGHQGTAYLRNLQWLSTLFTQTIFSINNLVAIHTWLRFLASNIQWWKYPICIFICYNSNPTLFPICSTTNILMSLSIHILVYYWSSSILVSTTLYIFAKLFNNYFSSKLSSIKLQILFYMSFTLSIWTRTILSPFPNVKQQLTLWPLVSFRHFIGYLTTTTEAEFKHY